MSLHKCQIGSVGGGRQGARASAMSWCRYVEREAEYGNKDGKLASFVRLPEGAPEEWRDPHALWSAVAEHEGEGARTGREFMVAFQDELTREQNIECARAFADRLAAVGLCAHVAVHRAPSGSEHAHITTPDRQWTDGGWAKTKRIVTYAVRRDGEEREITADEWKTAKADGWEKVYPFKDGEARTKSECVAEGLSWKEDRRGSQPIRGERSVTPATADQVVEWRKVWGEVVNEHLERYAPQAERVSHLSYADQGLDKVPGVHLGALATAAERDGFETIKGEKNRQIAAINEQIKNPDVPTEQKQELLEHGYELRVRHFDTAEQVREHTRPLLERVMEKVREVLEQVKERIAQVAPSFTIRTVDETDRLNREAELARKLSALDGYMDALNRAQESLAERQLEFRYAEQDPARESWLAAEKLAREYRVAETKLEDSKLGKNYNPVTERSAWKAKRERIAAAQERFDEVAAKVARYGGISAIEEMDRRGEAAQTRYSEAKAACAEAEKAVENACRSVAVAAFNSGIKLNDLTPHLGKFGVDRSVEMEVRSQYARCDAHRRNEMAKQRRTLEQSKGLSQGWGIGD